MGDMAYKRKEVIGDCTLYLGDSIEILNYVSAECLVTDPPYGVGLGEVVNGQAREKNQQPYTMFSDTVENIKNSVLPIIVKSLDICQRGIITPGNRNAFLYPEPDDFGVWYNPAGTGRGKWGYILAHAILYYGKDPRAGKCATASSAWALNDSVSEIKNKEHPCPKPVKFTKWMVDKASMEGETVLDPFMGSGTTGVACVELGRKFIGIEIEEKYFDLSCRRIEQAQRQPDMFLKEKIKQESLI